MPTEGTFHRANMTCETTKRSPSSSGHLQQQYAHSGRRRPAAALTPKQEGEVAEATGPGAALHGGARRLRADPGCRLGHVPRAAPPCQGCSCNQLHFVQTNREFPASEMLTLVT